MSDTTASSAAYDRTAVQPTATEDAHTIMVNAVSWGAIFAGVVVALVVQILLTMLGAGIGFATIGGDTASNPAASTFSISAGVWYIASGIIASFIGGYIAARMSGRTQAAVGALHGLTAWAFTTLLVLWLLSTTVGTLVGGAFSGLSSALGGLSQTITQQAGPALARVNPLEEIERQVRATGGDPEALNQNATNAVRALVTQGEEAAPEARDEAANALAAARGIPVEEARTQIQQIETQYRNAVDQTRQAAVRATDATASVVSTGALVAFASLVVGAIAGWLGGRSGVVHPMFADRLARSYRRS